MARKVINNLVGKVSNLCETVGIIQKVTHKVNDVTVAYYNHGPLGCIIRNNFIKHWWQITVLEPEYMYSNQKCPEILDKKENIFKQSEPKETKSIITEYPDQLKVLGHELPFGLAHIREGVTNCSEPQMWYLQNCGEQNELLFYFYAPPNKSLEWSDYFQRSRLRWWKKLCSLPGDFHLYESEVEQEEKEGEDSCIMYDFPWGAEPIETFRNHRDQPFKKAQETTEIDYQGIYSKRFVLPHVIEGVTNIEKGVMAFLMDAYRERNQLDCDNNIVQVMQMSSKLVPYHLAITIDAEKHIKKTLRELVDYLVQQLKGIRILDLQEKEQTLHQTFLRCDKLGVPLCLVLNDETLTIGMVKMRHRNTSMKEPMPITEVSKKVLNYVHNT